MSAGESSSNYASEQIKAEVRQTIRHLIEMTRTEESFDHFCQEVLTKIVKLTGAHGALLWQTNGNGPPLITHKVGGQSVQFSHDDPRHANLVVQVIEKQSPMGMRSELPPGEQSGTEQNGSAYLLLFSPVFNRRQQCCGTLELLQRSDITSSAQEGYLRFLTQIAQLFPRWHEQRDLERLTESADKWSNKIEFITEVHRSIDATETAYAIANESRRLLNCDRVSVANWNGRRCKVIAISSQDRFDNRANVVRKLGAVATSSVSSDTPLWITGDTEGIAPEVARRINDYLDESHCRTLAVIPLVDRPADTSDTEVRPHRSSKPTKLGALIVEFFDTDINEMQIIEDRNLVVKQSTLALSNARRHSEIFLLPLWQRLGRVEKLLFRDHLRKTIFACCCLLLFLLVLLFYPAQLKMKVDGVMQPELRRNIFAQTDGIIKNIHVDGRTVVKEGELLLELENKELDIRITEAQGQIETLDERIKMTKLQLAREPQMKIEDSIAIGGKLDQLENEKSNLRQQLDLMLRKKKAHEIFSPIDGTVVTWDARRRLKDLPVAANQAVLSLADFEGDWQIELRIPQNKIGYVSKALADNGGEPLETDFIVATNPNVRLQGKLVRIANRAELSQSGSPEFRAIVETDLSQLKDLQPGAGVTAKIRCGRRALGFVWFYQIVDFMRTRVFF